MRQVQHTLYASAVQALALEWLLPVLGRWPDARRCTAAAACAVLAYAASRLTSLSDACARLLGAPTGSTVLGRLGHLLRDAGALERRLQSALARSLPRAVFRRAWIVAVDTTLIPYHGLPFADPAEIYRGQRKSGTTHFHAYATAYLVVAGRRFTVALATVPYGTTSAEILATLLRRVRAAGIRIRLVLLDRGFNTAGVVRHLQCGRTAFIMPQAVHGSAPADGQLTGLRLIRATHPTGWTTYSWKPHGRGQRRVTVDLCVCRRHRRDRRGHGCFLYACGRVHADPRWIKTLYRRRFGIETSYRQMNQARIRTTTRRPTLRLLFVGVALLLRNLWAWLHWTALAQRRRGGRRVQLDRLRFSTMLQWLEHLAEAAFGFHDATVAEAPPRDDLTGRSP